MSEHTKRIKGAVDYLADNTIRGWVIDGDTKDSTLTVEIYLNGRKIGTTQCNRKRPNLNKNQQFPDRKPGFVFKDTALKTHKNPLSSYDIRYHTKSLHKNKHAIHSYLTQTDTDNAKDLFFFIHIPKTAGTSFRKMLYEFFPYSHIFPSVKDIYFNNGRYLPFASFYDLKPKKIRKLELIAGHYMARHSLFVPNTKRLVFLREPIARNISNIIHLNNHKPEFKDKTISLEEILATTQPNMQVRYLTTIPCPKAVNQRHLNSAINFLKSCDFIGITERFEESVALFEQQFDKKFKKVLQRNITSNKKTFEITPTLLEQVKKHSEWDIKLYQKAIEIFEERLERNK